MILIKYHGNNHTTTQSTDLQLFSTKNLNILNRVGPKFIIIYLAIHGVLFYTLILVLFPKTPDARKILSKFTKQKALHGRYETGHPGLFTGSPYSGLLKDH